MNKNGLLQAQAALVKCRTAVETLNQSKKLEDGASAWSDFLTFHSRVYTKLKEGAKGHGKSEAWYGRVNRMRKDDPLLCYIHHARNSDEHSIEEIAQPVGLVLTFHFDYLRETVAADGSIQILMGRDDGSASPGYFKPPHLKLLPVCDRRFGDQFLPPDSHLGVPLSVGSPHEVATLTVAYLERITKEAGELPA